MDEQDREHGDDVSRTQMYSGPGGAALPDTGGTAPAVSGVSPGTRFGPYEIVERIGEGGMGEVYKARDTRLERLVAVKVSKTAFSARFAIEARAAAALNHSHICTLHDVGQNYLVMEYLDGAVLRGPVPLAQALQYAIQICSALEAAHQKGIVHRDLKPANVFITKSGVKLLDFGLAKMTGGGGGRMQDRDVALTGQHEIVGTLCYMSPEQLRGRFSGAGGIDGRSDIFSFGLVLYELLTGKRVYDATAAADVFAAILERPAPSIASFTNPALDRLLQRCLKKDPDERWQTVHDLKAELEWIAAGNSGIQEASGSTPTPEASLPADETSRRTPPRPWRRIAATYGPWLVAASSLAALLIVLNGSPPAQPPVVVRTAIAMPGARFVDPSISRDGSRLVYVENGMPARLWVRTMDEMEGKPVPGTEGGEAASLSPDGDWIVFLKGPPPYKLAKIPVTGGTATIVSSETGFIVAPHWGEDGFIVAGSSQGLARVPASGGKLEFLTKADAAKGELGHFQPSPLPGGRGILFSVGKGTSLDSGRDTAEIAVLDLQSRIYKLLQNAGTSPHYEAKTGNLVYRRGSTLYAAPFDPRRLEVRGREAPVLDGVAAGLATGASPYSFTPDGGLLLYRMETDSRERTSLAWLDRKGVAQVMAEPPHPWRTTPLSPDGRRIAAELADPGQDEGNERIWIYELDRTARGALTSRGSRDFNPIWAPDGRSVTFASNNRGKFAMYRLKTDSGGEPELLLATESISYPGCWAPDGSSLVYTQYDQGKSRIFVLPMLAGGNAGEPRRFHPETAAGEGQPVVSPDGKWLAYRSDHSGRPEIYVSPFPGPGSERFQVSTDGASLPKWSPDGRELFFVELNPRRLLAVDVVGGARTARLQFGPPKPLFVIRNDGGAVYYDVAPDGKRFLALMPQGGPAGATTFVVVTDWFAELSRRSAVKR